MRSQFTLEYWRDGDFYVGRLLEVPGVFSQGETLEELRENIQDAYGLVVTQERSPAPAAAQQQPLELDGVLRRARLRLSVAVVDRQRKVGERDAGDIDIEERQLLGRQCGELRIEGSGADRACKDEDFRTAHQPLR